MFVEVLDKVALEQLLRKNNTSLRNTPSELYSPLFGPGDSFYILLSDLLCRVQRKTCNLSSTASRNWNKSATVLLSSHIKLIFFSFIHMLLCSAGCERFIFFTLTQVVSEAVNFKTQGNQWWENEEIRARGEEKGTKVIHNEGKTISQYPLPLVCVSAATVPVNGATCNIIMFNKWIKYGSEKT